MPTNSVPLRARLPARYARAMADITVPAANISTDAALEICKGAVAKAAELGIRINVSVCDSAGLQMAFLRMNGAFIHSIDIAIDKAYTAASFQMPSGQWPEIFKADEPLKTGMPVRPRNVVFAGGLPLTVDGQIVGGVGVSGGSAEQDTECAAAGMNAVGMGIS